MKRFHGLNRAKFWGIEKINVQAMLTGIVVNLKRFVKMSSDSYRNLC
jgi:transposase